MITGNIFDEPEGATPLDPDDAAGLIPSWIATRADLNSAEQGNIAKARTWAFVQHGPWTPEQLLDEPVIRAIHKRMFDEVWKWAGTYRVREANLGVAPYLIPAGVKALVDDVRFQTSVPDDLPWGADELAVRFHHRLVAVHPFPNGNGRHARFCADILVMALGERPFSWAGGDLSSSSEPRERYLEALRVADAENEYGPLTEFARS